MGRHLTGPDTREWIQRFIDVLGELDRLAGDGDFGTNLAAALRRASRRVSDGPSGSASAVFARISEGFLDTGGTSGPLFGMWFRELSKATAQSADAGALAAGVAADVAAVDQVALSDRTDGRLEAQVPEHRSVEAANEADLKRQRRRY